MNHAPAHTLSLKNYILKSLRRTRRWSGKAEVQRIVDLANRELDAHYLHETGMRRVRELVEDGLLDAKTERPKSGGVRIAFYRA